MIRLREWVRFAASLALCTLVRAQTAPAFEAVSVKYLEPAHLCCPTPR